MKNNKLQVLIVEDDLALCKTLINQLNCDYTIEGVNTIEDAHNKINKKVYDLFLIDLILPGLQNASGIELCRNIRLKNNTVPIIIITGKSAINYKISAFKAGINDYVCKPFNTLELAARMKVWVNIKHNTGKILVHRDIKINTDMHTVTRAEKKIDLRKKEFELLKLFVLNKNTLLTRDTISQKLSMSDKVFSNVVDVHVRNLRKKIDAPFKHNVIKTVHGVGYVIQ